MRQYDVGDRVVLSAVVKYANPRRQLVVLKFPDGSETDPMSWETVEALEADARSMLYTPENPTDTQPDTIQVDTPEHSD